MTAETFPPGTKGIITNLVKLILREQVEMLLPWWTKSIWSALLRYPYIWPRRVPSHRRNFPRFCYLNFMKFTFLGFHVVVLVKTFPLIDVSITNIELILTKLRWFQLFVTSQNSISFFLITIFMFPCCSTREDLSIDVSITNVWLILTKILWFLFSGYGQTDTVLKSHMETCLHTKKFNSNLKIRS